MNQHPFSSWQKRRSSFNHDWLKNQFMPALAKWLNLLDNKIEDPDFERAFIASVLPKWEQHREEALRLPRDFEQEMSPRRLFECHPLAHHNVHTKQWLGNLIHGLWLTRHPVEQWVAEASGYAQQASDAYAKLKQSLNDCGVTQDASSFRPYRQQFAEFRDLCQKLAKAIERFPSGVKIV